MNTSRIEEIIKTTAYPDSASVYSALLQVWNEISHEVNNANKIYLDELKRENTNREDSTLKYGNEEDGYETVHAIIDSLEDHFKYE